LFSVAGVVCPVAFCGVVRQSNGTNPIANINVVRIFMK